MMLLFCAKHILHNNLRVSVNLRGLRVAIGRHVPRETFPSALTDYERCLPASVEESKHPKRDLVADADLNVVTRDIALGLILYLLDTVCFSPFEMFIFTHFQ